MTSCATAPQRSHGILPLLKPKGKTSFHLVSMLRKLTRERTIGHAGTLDPFATGVMILLIGKKFTRLSSQFINFDKSYHARIHLGVATDSYDIDGRVTSQSSEIPSRAQVEEALVAFQGTTQQVPPMFSAKKVGGKKLYELARQGVTIERAPVSVTMHIELLTYAYPYLELQVKCSKGTYIRSLAHDLGSALKIGAHLAELTRTSCGPFSLSQCCDATKLFEPNYDWNGYLHDHLPQFG